MIDVQTSNHKSQACLYYLSLIHFHRASLHTVFPFGKPQALTTNLRDYLTSSGRSRGLLLFSNLQGGGVIQRKWSITIRWMIFRGLLRSCIYGVCVSGVECENTKESAAGLQCVVLRSDLLVRSSGPIR
jgi:hypothetical protein